MKLTSSALADGGTVPAQFTCDGVGGSPPLEWKGVPRGAEELALLVEDPDAPGGTFVHWILFGIDPGTRSIAAGQKPAGAKQGQNGFSNTDWGGPCPPKGDESHRYVFTLYALSKPLDLAEGASGGDVRSAIDAAAISKGTLTATYGR